MSAYPEIYLVRHGETEWSLSGRHTGRSEIALTEAGENAARRVADRLPKIDFAAVWSSPSRRARRTSELAGYGPRSSVDPDLAEWDYGAYEGLTTREILAARPTWQLFRDGCPDGETAENVAARADAVIDRIRAANATILIFSSAHFLRVLGARWIGLPPGGGACLVLDTASISVLGYEHNLAEPVIRSWNRT